MGLWLSVTIARAGTAISGSPYSVKLRYRRLHIDPQIAPMAARRPVQEFLIFENVTAAVETGDVVTLPDGIITKIIDVRQYPSSLQCMLQRLPYITLQIWGPKPVLSSIQSDKSLSDLSYQSAGTIEGLIEPHGVSQAGPLPIGHVDRRSAWLFSTQSIAIHSVILNSSDYWLVIETSSSWPASNDFRAPLRRLSSPPLGVS